MECSWGKFQGTEHFVGNREIFEIVEIESIVPLFVIAKNIQKALTGLSESILKLGKLYF